MAKGKPPPKHRLPSTDVSPAVEDAIERTWPSADPSSPPAETPAEVHARVCRFFVEVFDNNRKLGKIRRAQQAQANASQKAQAPFVQEQKPPPPPQVEAPSPKPKPKRKKAGPSPLKVFGIAAASVGAVVIIGKAVLTYSERKRPQPKRRLTLLPADEFDELNEDIEPDDFGEDLEDVEETSSVTFNHTTHNHTAVIDSNAIEAMAPKLQSFVSEAVSKNFDEGKAVQHIHQHQHTQHVHPVTKTEHIIERSVPGPKGDKGNTGRQGKKGDKGDRGDPGGKGDKGDTGNTGRQGKKGDKGNTGRKGNKGDPGKSVSQAKPIRHAQNKNSKGFFDD